MAAARASPVVATHVHKTEDQDGLEEWLVETVTSVVCAMKQVRVQCVLVPGLYTIPMRVIGAW